MNVDQRPGVPYRGTPWYRRALAVLGLGASGAVLGAILAILAATVAVGAFVLVNALLG